MTKHNAANERIKRDYLAYLKEALGRDEATIDGVAKSLARFEESTKARDFKRFHREQAVAFKAALAKATNVRTGERISKATMLSTLRDLRDVRHDDAPTRPLGRACRHHARTRRPIHTGLATANRQLCALPEL